MTGLSLAQVGEFSFVLAAVGLPLGLFAGRRLPGVSVSGSPVDDGNAVSHQVGAPDLGIDRRTAQGLGVEGSRHGTSKQPPQRGRQSSPTTPSSSAMVSRDGISRGCSRPPGSRARWSNQDAELVRRARADGLPAVYGDGTRHAMLERVACTRARIIVFAISSPVEERRGVAVAREVAPAAQIVVRTRYVRAIDESDAARGEPGRGRGVRSVTRAVRACARELRDFRRPASRTSSRPCGTSTTACCAAPRRPT